MKIAFFGTGDFSVNILKSLINDYKKDIEIELVVSQPDKPVGRKKELQKTPVKIVAENNNLEFLQPEKLRENINFFNELKKLDLDFIIVVAYGKIIPKEILEIPKFGCINIHGSILPLYRGASPIQESIKNGDEKTGLTIMYMSEGMDEGDILSIREIEILEDDKTSDIFKKFEEFGPKLLVETIKGVFDGSIKGQKQDDSKSTYCSKITKTDGEIDFEKISAKEIYDKFRAYSPWPGIYGFYNGKKLNFEYIELEDIDLSLDSEFNIGEVVELEDEHNAKNRRIGIIAKGGIIILRQVKLEGKKSIDILSFINGNKEFLDYKF